MTAGSDSQVYLVDVALPVPLPGPFTYRWRGDPATGATADVGDLVIVPFGRRQRLIGLVVRITAAAADTREVDGHRLRDIRRVLPPEYSLGRDRLALARWLADYYGLQLGEVVPLFHPPAPGTQRRASRRAEAIYPELDAQVVTLSPAQHQAVRAATEHLENRSFGTILLHGVTGSGKTEVYLRVIEEAVSRQRQAIYLLPEIALTPQTLQRITARFGAAVAALHSGLSAGERCRVHEAAARGELQVVVGPRSALFVPLPDLGAVIVDEEHETSYKQDEKPRYHARYAALVRARECGAVALLGSATPDLESYVNGRDGRYTSVTLPDRQGGELPPVEIVDMRGTIALDGLSDRLTEAIDETLVAKRQVILYYNRRGFARVLQCSECGEADTCPHCDIALTYHLRPARLLCHYCGYRRAVSPTCQHCDARSFLPAGGGTERLELATQANFPEARVLRLDQDTTRRRGSHGRILAAFAAGEADILVGTQMVAKGHHFPGVDLVGVAAADDGLSLPDYRAAERTFQLLTQVAGRAGRTRPGRVLFQTYQPESPVILNAAGHDYTTFVGVELAQRQQLGYPPYRRLLRIGISGRRRGRTEEAAGVLAAAVREILSRRGRTILGPAPGVLPRLQDRYRYQILIKGTLVVREKRWLADCIRSLLAERRGLDAHLDVDPVGIF